MSLPSIFDDNVRLTVTSLSPKFHSFKARLRNAGGSIFPPNIRCCPGRLWFRPCILCVPDGCGSAPGACFSKVPKLFGRISGDIILFVSSKRRRLEARNFAVILIFIPFTTYEKTSFTEKAGRSFTNGFSGPKSSRDFRETGPCTLCVVDGRIEEAYNISQTNYIILQIHLFQWTKLL